MSIEKDKDFDRGGWSIVLAEKEEEEVVGA